MAYADRNNTGSRVVSMGIVMVIMVAVGYAFVTGLAFQYVKKVAEKMNTFDVPPPPPPPPDVPPPPPPPDQKMTPPPVVTPPPIVQTNVPPPVVIQSVPTPPPVVPFVPVAAPPAPAAPPPPKISQQAQAKGNPGSWFNAETDYPPDARRAGTQGRTVIRVTVGTDGRISGCTVTASSGSSSLDDVTCKVAQRRGRYTPAKDENGNPMTSTATIPVRWQLQD
jgi:periplasmic protein TonB